MCGIVGYFSRTPAPSQTQMATLNAMNATLAHRGPNGAGQWQDKEGYIALGHQRLAIHDLNPRANQPMISESGRFILVFNGEIYNFLDLRQKLEKENIHFTTDSDTEVLLALCERAGMETTLSLIQGMFAFALWDQKEKVLFLARDHIGKKPLYYYQTPTHFLFASELKAFEPNPAFKKTICEDAMKAYFEYGYVPQHHSIYQNTFKLLPGHVLRINQQFNVQTAAYWKPKRTPIDPRCDILNETKIRLKNAVRTRLASDVPLGAFLSGGIDSSLITALMQNESTKPIHTFSIGFQNKEYDESHYAEKIAATLGTHHQTLIVTEKEAQTVIPNLTTLFDEPFADSSAIPSLLLAQFAKKEVSVVQTGDGGDEVFAGYNRYYYAHYLKYLACLPRFMRKNLAKPFKNPGFQACFKNTLFKHVPQFQQKCQKLIEALSFENEQESYEQIVKTFQLSATAVDTALQTNDFVSLWQQRDLMGYLPDDVLTKVDRATMSAGLEARSPFLDISLIEWGLSLPLHFKIRHKQTKWILRALLKEYLSESLFTRPKQGFAIPVSLWLKNELKSWAESLLFEVSDPSEMIAQNTIHGLWQAHQEGTLDASQQLWTILMWRQFIAKSGT